MSHFLYELFVTFFVFQSAFINFIYTDNIYCKNHEMNVKFSKIIAPHHLVIDDTVEHIYDACWGIFAS